MIHSDVYKAIRDRLWNADIDIRHIDLWHNQVQQALAGESMPFARKAVFIDFGEGQFHLLGNRKYELVYNLQLHIVDDAVSETSRMETRTGDATPEYAVEIAMSRLNVVDDILYHLTGFSAPGMRGGLQAVGMSMNSEEATLTHDVMTWMLRMETNVAKRVLVSTEPQGVVLPKVVLT